MIDTKGIPEKLERLADWAIDQELDEITANYEAIIKPLCDEVDRLTEEIERIKYWENENKRIFDEELGEYGADYDAVKKVIQSLTEQIERIQVIVDWAIHGDDGTLNSPKAHIEAGIIQSILSKGEKE